MLVVHISAACTHFGVHLLHMRGSFSATYKQFRVHVFDIWGTFCATYIQFGGTDSAHVGYIDCNVHAIWDTLGAHLGYI